jgi:hypothetical protein
MRTPLQTLSFSSLSTAMQLRPLRSRHVEQC